MKMPLIVSLAFLCLAGCSRQEKSDQATAKEPEHKVENEYTPPPPPSDQAVAKNPERKSARVGQIFVIGNERTELKVIMDQVGFSPGEEISWPKIKKAEENLARLGIFKSSSDGATGPRIIVQNNRNNPDSEYKDVFIKVEEDDTGRKP